MSTDDELELDLDPVGEDIEDLEVVQEPETVELITNPNDGDENAANQEGASDEVAPANDADKKDAKVKRVRNPQPKLDAERLRGPRGLMVLEDIFKKVKFKGPKHEEEDLNKMMKTYEYWCHRLFPKFPFDDCLQRFEKLGNTKNVQSYIKKIRMDLVEEDTPLVDSDNEDTNTPETIQNTAAINIPDKFDSLLPPTVYRHTQSIDSPSTELTDEQLERIRLNRLKAEQRRKQVMTGMSQTTQDLFNVRGSENSDITSTSQSSSVNFDTQLTDFVHEKQNIDSVDNFISTPTSTICSQGDSNLCVSPFSTHIRNTMQDSDSEASFNFSNCFKGNKSKAAAGKENRQGEYSSQSNCTPSSQPDRIMFDATNFSQHSESGSESDNVRTSQSDTVMHDVMSISQSDGNLQYGQLFNPQKNQVTDVALSMSDGQLEADQMSVVNGVATSQESMSVLTNMSIDSNKCISSTEDMLVSEVDSPMDVDSL